MTTILLSPKHQGLARIALLQSEERWLEIATKKLPKTLRKMLSLFFPALTGGEELTDDIVTLLVSFNEDKSYNRTYAPAIYANEDGEVCVCWGNVLYPLTAATMDNLDAEFEVTRVERFEEKCIVFTIDDEDLGFLALPLVIKLNSDNYEIEDRKVKKLVKDRNLKGLADILYVKVPGKGGDFTPTSKFTELPELADIFVWDSELKDFGSHKNYILDVTVGEDTESVMKCFCPSDLKNALLAGAEIVPGQTSFTYMMKEGYKGKPKAVVTIFDLQWNEEDDEIVKV